jgi:hypothetical protein
MLWLFPVVEYSFLKKDVVLFSRHENIHTISLFRLSERKNRNVLNA